MFNQKQYSTFCESRILRSLKETCYGYLSVADLVVHPRCGCLSRKEIERAIESLSQRGRVTVAPSVAGELTVTVSSQWKSSHPEIRPWQRPVRPEQELDLELEVEGSAGPFRCLNEVELEVEPY